MTNSELIDFFRAKTGYMVDLVEKKNSDYTGAHSDPFCNFKKVDIMDVCSPEQGFLVRMLDKYARLTSFVNNGTLLVKDESVQDTLLDLANYALLFSAFIESKKQAHLEKGNE